MNRKKLFQFIITFLVVIYVGWTFISQQIDMMNNSSRLSDYDKKIAVQLDKQDQLNKEKELVNTPEYMEKIARDHVGMVKPDETLFVDILANQ